MRRARALIISGALILLTQLGFGQITQLENETDFDPDRVLLTFNPALEGADASNIVAGYGVRLEGIGGGTPTVRGDLIGGQPFGLISNDAPAGQGITSELVINFRYPVRQVGFLLTNGTPGLQARFTFRNVRGENIGTRIVPADESTGPFAGFEAPPGESFSRIVLSYGDSPNAEQFFELIFTYSNRPLFTTYLAQVADGALPNGGLRTDILIANLSNTTANGSLAIIGDNGDPVEVTLNGTAASSFNLAIPPQGLRRFTSSGTSQPPVQGYARIQTDVPVDGLAIFQILNAAGNPTSEAGVGSSTAFSESVAAVVRQVQGTIDSGLAVANVGDETATVTAQLLAPTGAVVATNNTFFSIPAHTHTATFLPTLFPTVPADFQGTLVLSSSQPLTVTVLRTASGLVLSSLPVGSLQR